MASPLFFERGTDGYNLIKMDMERKNGWNMHNSFINWGPYIVCCVNLKVLNCTRENIQSLTPTQMV
jgi:hypothetical protein